MGIGRAGTAEPRALGFGRDAVPVRETEALNGLQPMDTEQAIGIAPHRARDKTRR